VDDFFVNNGNTVSNWAYKVVDLRFGFDSLFGNTDLRPFFGIDNLFDERYKSSVIVNAYGPPGGQRYFEPSPSREFYVGVTVGFGVN
jgi:iron complex outermembrane receptor protein